MAGEISNYSTEELIIEANVDWVDVSVLISTGPDVYDSRKTRPSTLLSARLPFGIVRRYKASGNTDLTADESGDWRQRVNGSGNFVHEVFNGATWDVKGNFLG